MANSIDPDQTAASLIWVYTVCPDLSVGKLRIITVLATYLTVLTGCFEGSQTPQCYHHLFS